MRQVLAILRDSYHEAIARRSLVVMIVLSTLPILFFSSLEFEEATIAEGVESQVAELESNLVPRSLEDSDKLRLTEVTAAADTPGPLAPWSAAVAEGWVFQIQGDLSLADDRRRRWMRGWARRNSQPWDEDDGWTRFLTLYFTERGCSAVEVQESDGLIAVAVTAESTEAIAGGHRLRMLWGAWGVELQELSAGRLLVGLQSAMALGLVGFIGILLAIVLTAALIPNMLEKGTLDLMLARPIGRTKPLLSKFVGGLWFVAILGTYAITGSWLALRVATGYGSAWVLIAIPAMVGAFAVLYSVSALVGVLTRSTLNGILAACGVWFLSTLIEGGRNLVATFGRELSPWVGEALETVYWIFPKLGAFDALVVETLSAAELPTGAGASPFDELGPPVDLPWAIGTTMAFAAVMLTLAIWVFRRRDY